MTSPLDMKEKSHPPEARLNFSNFLQDSFYVCFFLVLCPIIAKFRLSRRKPQNNQCHTMHRTYKGAAAATSNATANAATISTASTATAAATTAGATTAAASAAVSTAAVSIVFVACQIYVKRELPASAAQRVSAASHKLPGVLTL
jgi:heme/copper-type cytochrome/quinol oxidase subunit 3